MGALEKKRAQVAEKQNKVAEDQAKKKRRLEVPEAGAERKSTFKDTIKILAVASKNPDHPNFSVLNIYTVIGMVNGGKPQPLTAVFVDQKSYDECFEEDDWLTYRCRPSQGLSENGLVSISVCKYPALDLPIGVRNLYVCPSYDPDLVGFVRTKSRGKACIELVDTAALPFGSA